jgi:HD-GYP domain-containing protein (c-di-GMP phosphodiesterase class II)
MMVYQHHERVDGCGYPVGLQGNEIHEWARICAVANSYDALLRDVPQHDRRAVDNVLRNLELQSDRSLDKEITQCWIETIKANPPQT